MSGESDQPLSFSCPHCSKRLRAPKTLAGKNLACPKCKTKITVPAVIPTAVIPTAVIPTAVIPTAGIPTAGIPTASIATVSNEDAWLRLDDELNPEPAANSGSEVRSALLQASDAPQAIDPTAKGKTKSVFDDDLPELLPLEPPAAIPSLPLDLGLPDIDLEDLDGGPLDSRSTASSGPKMGRAQDAKKSRLDSLDDLKLETAALGDSFALPPNDEFSFPCRICGSLLYALGSRAGSSIRCADCYSELTIPKPARKASKQPQVSMDDLPSVALQPIDAKSTRRDIPVRSDEILEKASQALEEETRTSSDYDGGFDTQRWLQLILGFMRDPWVVAATVGLGLCTGAWLFAICLMGTWVKMEVTQAMIARIAIFGVLLIPVVGAICLCGLSVLTMAANRSPRVEEWPLSRMGDAIGESFLLIAALILASIPGGMVGGIVAGLNAHPLVASAIFMLGIWAATPFLLLSMIDNGAMTQPYSKPVFDSIKAFSDAWGAMYMQSGLAFGLLFCIMILAELQSPVGSIFLGFAIPFTAFFVLNQYGVLAGRISHATNLGFDGDFSDDSL